MKIQYPDCWSRHSGMLSSAPHPSFASKKVLERYENEALGVRSPMRLGIVYSALPVSDQLGDAISRFPE